MNQLYSEKGQTHRSLARQPLQEITNSKVPNEVFDSMLTAENHYKIIPNYMDFQPELNFQLRAILVDWLIAVHLKLKLQPETLHLTVNLLDSYLSGCRVEKRQLQLVGTACLLVAAKYEEI